MQTEARFARLASLFTLVLGLCLFVQVSLFAQGAGAQSLPEKPEDLPLKIQIYLERLDISVADIEQMDIVKRSPMNNGSVKRFDHWLSVRDMPGSLVVQTDFSANVLGAYTTGEYRLKGVPHRGI
ncbi:MAG: hypothetical protein ACPGOV_00835 [Magnetovibrionaceae bacterium]